MSLTQTQVDGLKTCDAAVAGVMSLRPKMKFLEKVAWVVILTALVVFVFHAIDESDTTNPTPEPKFKTGHFNLVFGGDAARNFEYGDFNVCVGKDACKSLVNGNCVVDVRAYDYSPISPDIAESALRSLIGSISHCPDKLIRDQLADRMAIIALHRGTL